MDVEADADADADADIASVVPKACKVGRYQGRIKVIGEGLAVATFWTSVSCGVGEGGLELVMRGYNSDCAYQISPTFALGSFLPGRFLCESLDAFWYCFSIDHSCPR